MNNRIVAGGVVIRKNKETNENEVLLIQRSSSDHWPLYWEFARGGCEKEITNNQVDKQDIYDCVKREVKEETGLDVEPMKYIDSFSYISRKGKTTQHNFLCRMKNPDQNIKLSKEHQDFKWESSYGIIQVQIAMSEIRNTILKALDYKEDGINISIPQKNKVIKECISKLEKNYLKYSN